MENLTEQQKQLLQLFEDLTKSEGSQNKACEKVGISAQVMTPLRKGTYKGNTDACFEKLTAYFGIKEENAKTYAEIEYADTQISSDITKIIRNCQIKGGLAIAAGDAGIGKTKAAKHFVKEHVNEAVYISVNPCISNTKSLLKVLANKIGASGQKTIDEIWTSIIGKLHDGMIIIIDEAQHLTIKTIEVLRSFTDYFADLDQTLGIVFIGNLETVHRLGVKKAEFAQIISRTKQTKIYGTDGIKRSDIELLFPILSGKEAEIDFLLKIANSPQALRGTINLFSNAYDNEDYSYAGLVAMAKFMQMM